MGLFGKTHKADTDSAWVTAYALADGTHAYQARCSCGWFSDVFVEELQFVRDLRQDHADTGRP
ncbi:MULTISPECIES: hypothetical protein [Nocardiopsidaceae]|uniref:Transposase n=1 Tax=Streptomonospora nanhaiensis TaxID=1323731 RepID=A0ABY6YLN6_9ACTN|nr:hypothetical protein [Streptomonospora nanhaiensis]WAE72941.1 hypothetical protein OUQ99_27860 [Streptomonospora nanhaiensis]